MAYHLRKPPLLGQDNYLLWSRTTELHLKALDQWDVVDGSYRKPTEASFAPEFYMMELKKWNFADANALFTIHNSCDPKNQIIIIDCQTAKEAWDRLRSIFAYNSEEHLAKMHRDFVSFKMGETESIYDFFGRLVLIRHTQSLLKSGNFSRDKVLPRDLVGRVTKEWVPVASNWLLRSHEKGGKEKVTFEAMLAEALHLELAGKKEEARYRRRS